MIAIGTSGYHFEDWTGSFYPADLPRERWLAYYAEHFPVVEINATYYGLPAPGSVARWVAETPSGFRFFVKLNKVSTHERTGEGEETAELLAAVAPLLEEGRLAGLLAQFPASFHAGPREREYLTVLAERLATLPLFVELRHRSWDSDESVELLRRLKVGWVAVDQPRLPSLGGPRPAVAGQAGYVRFHGRNSATWYNPDRGDRYDWDYSQRELEEWVPRLEAMEARAGMNYLFFNNCHMGQAVKSAMKMRTLLSQQFEIL